jgi:hypothetical protein
MLTPLLVNRTWESDAHRATEEASTLITQIMLAECTAPGTPEEGDCVEYTPQNAPVLWGPTNPFINPSDIPAGYLNPVWHVVDDPGLFFFLGVRTGDVLTLPDAFPIGVPPLHDFLPKMRIYCHGTGTVEIHLLEVPFGGLAIITQDDDILTLKIVELEHATGEVPVESVAPKIVEIEFTTGGDHHIDVMFERRLDLTDLIPIGFGGGLRKVVLCGFDIPGESVDVRQNVDAPCTLEKSADGETWVPFADLKLCPPDVRISKGKVQIILDGVWTDVEGAGDERYDGDIEPPYPDPPEGETGNCLAAENIIAALATSLTQTKEGLTIGASVTGIGSIVASGIAFMAALPAALIGAAVLVFVAAGQALGAGGIDDVLEGDELDDFKCMIDCEAESDGSITLDVFNTIKDRVNDEIGGGVGTLITAWMDSLGPVGMNRAATTSGIMTGDCDACPCNFDFSIEYCAGYGDGPTLGSFGDTITFTGPGSGGGYEGYWAQFSQLVKLTVLSVDGYVDGDPGAGATMYWYHTTNTANCDLFGSDHVFTAPQPTGASGLSVDLWHFGHLSHSTGTFSITVLIEEP